MFRVGSWKTVTLFHAKLMSNVVQRLAEVDQRCEGVEFIERGDGLTDVVLMKERARAVFQANGVRDRLLRSQKPLRGKHLQRLQPGGHQR